MHAACGKVPGADIPKDDEPPPAWYNAPPTDALPKAGEEYLRHVLSKDQLALHRVVTRDAHRFPELGRRYHEATTGTHAKFAGYLDLWAKRERWSVRDKHAAAQVFAGLLKARIFDEVLLGLHQSSDAEIARKAREAAKSMLLLLNDGRF
jgi:hypothetical protein